MEITVTQFKARCLGIIERVQKERTSVVITRHGRPAAELVPVASRTGKALFGRAKGDVRIHGDILSTGEAWDAAR